MMKNSDKNSKILSRGTNKNKSAMENVCSNKNLVIKKPLKSKASTLSPGITEVVVPTTSVMPRLA